MRGQTTRMVLCGAAGALVALATLFLRVPVPMMNGYCNLGDAVILASGALLGPLAGVAAAVGGGLADLLAGFGVYAPVTVAIKGVMGWVAGTCCAKARTTAARLLWMLGTEIWMAAGYFAFEAILYGLPAGVANLPGNGLQGVVSVTAALALWPLTIRMKQTI